MRQEDIDVDAAVARYFDASSLAPHEKPRVVILIGPPGVGKTSIRRIQYSTGYVLIDAAEIFADLRGEPDQPFPNGCENALWIVGRLAARRALGERRHIVTELDGPDERQVSALIHAMRALDYSVKVPYVHCDAGEAYRRTQVRPLSEISAWQAGPYNYAWLHAEALQIARPTGVVAETRRQTASGEGSAKGQIDACVDGIACLSFAVERMRAGLDGDVSSKMAASTREAFDVLDRQGDDGRLVGLLAIDFLYRQVSTLRILDDNTRRYAAGAVRECFRQLMLRELPTFHIIDNAIAADRLAAVIELLKLAGITVFTTARDHRPWPELQVMISALLDMGIPVAYIEPDDTVNNLAAACEFARSCGYPATFRNLEPANPAFEILSAG